MILGRFNDDETSDDARLVVAHFFSCLMDAAGSGPHLTDGFAALLIIQLGFGISAILWASMRKDLLASGQSPTD